MCLLVLFKVIEGNSLIVTTISMLRSLPSSSSPLSSLYQRGREGKILALNLDELLLAVTRGRAVEREREGEGKSKG